MLVDTDHPTDADAQAALNRALRQLDLVTSGLAHTGSVTTVIPKPTAAGAQDESSATTRVP
ncbi:Putative transcriptional regulator, TetR family [Mycobacteroides abscessus subsp. massiliense]|nr:Putative transcriptional regulator, TetR family [Mycobacteroides abscessus subsp. massiliense]